MVDFQFKKILVMPSGEYESQLVGLYKYMKLHFRIEFYFLSSSRGYIKYPELAEEESSYIEYPELSEECDWEKDHNEVTRLKKLIKLCEEKTRIPINRILLSNERSIGRRYSKSKYYWQENKLARMNLKDETLSDKILLRCFKFCYDTLSVFNPDIMIGGIAGPVFNIFFYWVAQLFNIKYISCVESMFLDDRYGWTDKWASYPYQFEAEYKKIIQTNLKPSNVSLNKIQSFIENPSVLPVYNRLWKGSAFKLTLRKVYKGIYESFKYRAVPIIRRKKLTNAKPFWQAVIMLHRGYIYPRLQKKYYQMFPEEQLKSTNYLYYPMHQEPEFVLNTRAYAWYDQLNTIRLLSSCLPYGYKLLVKEHRFNSTRRPSRYLKYLCSLPNVILINPFDTQFKYIQNSNLIVTVNGTTGFEALMLKKKVMTLSKTFYDILSLSYSIKDINKISEELMNALNASDYDDRYIEKIATLMDAERNSTFALRDSPDKAFIALMNFIKYTNSVSPKQIVCRSYREV